MKTKTLYRKGEDGLETCSAYPSQVPFMENAGWSSKKEDAEKKPAVKPAAKPAKSD